MLQQFPNQQCFFTRARFLAVCAAVLFSVTMRVAAALPMEPPEAFFTNVADRLLQQQLGVRLTEIQIAPTNQYSAAVHRVFQVTANVYDATSTNLYPAIFRPQFETRSNGVFLAGFTNDNHVSTLHEWLDSNPHGVPLVIATRKGFPNFNEFATWTEFLVSRRLQLTRPTTNSPPNATNVMYTLSISNQSPAELWNSYELAYPRPAAITISNFITATMTNESGLILENSAAWVVTTNFGAYAWKGRNDFRSFVVPQSITNAVLTNSTYRFTDNSFEPLTTNIFETFTGFPLPKWTLTISNYLSCLISEDDFIVDFVLLRGKVTVNLSKDLLSGLNAYPSGTPAAISGIWSTNLSSPGAPTDGIRQQIDISAGDVYYQLTAQDWRAFSATGVQSENDKAQAISTFREFLKLPGNPGQPPPQPNANLAMLAPFNPAAKLVVASTWQANDPLVHHHINDVQSDSPTNYYFRLNQPATNIAPATLGRLNSRYSPWLGQPYTSTYPEFSDRALKDAGVYSSDQWNFPSNQTSFAAHWLGRVHRGTPWQTIYLQADSAPVTEWIQSGGDPRAHPTNDWRMSALLASLFNTNDVRTLRSVNTTNFDAWAVTLNGLTVLSNNSANPQLGGTPTFEHILVTSSAPQVALVVDDINRIRAAQRGQYFADVAAFLSVPELSSAAPWLHLSTGEQTLFGLTDEAYEALPSQLLSLVRADPTVAAQRIGNSIELRFTAFDGYAYRVESSSDFATWTTVGEPHYGTNGVFRLTVPATSSPQFFRAALMH